MIPQIKKELHLEKQNDMEAFNKKTQRRKSGRRGWEGFPEQGNSGLRYEG